MAAKATRRQPAPLFTGTMVVVSLMGVVLTAGGVWLVALGGSLYYLVAGVALLMTGWLLAIRSGMVFWVYAALLLGTIVWAVWEVRRMLENDGRVISNFIVQALRGEPITVYGTGQQTRSFCFVNDLVRGLTMLMESSASITGPINLGNPEETSVEAIAREILARTRSTSELEFRPLPQDDPKRRKPSIEAAESRLGWRPRVSLTEGLEATIAYFTLLVASTTPTGLARMNGRTPALAISRHLGMTRRR